MVSEVRKPAPSRFMVLIYRVPAKPTSNRVYVWRLLKKIGAVYLQQSVCVFPQNARVWRDLRPILQKIDESSGEYHLLPLRKLPPSEEQKLVAQFVEQTTRHYQEIVENCEVNFTKEIEFETFRQNFTYEEAEEIRTEYEKIVAWFERVQARDWFGAPNRDEALAWLDRCAKMLEEFEGRVFSSEEPRGNGWRSRARRGSLRGKGRPMRLVDTAKSAAR
jgi:Protein ChrB, N-terminal